jgi:hypothetical protein
MAEGHSDPFGCNRFGRRPIARFVPTRKFSQYARIIPFYQVVSMQESFHSTRLLVCKEHTIAKRTEMAEREQILLEGYIGCVDASFLRER